MAPNDDDTGNSDTGQGTPAYDPGQQPGVLGNYTPPAWNVPDQPSVFGDAFNPKPWTFADNTLQAFVDPPTMKTIDFQGADAPQAAPDAQGQPSQPDADGFTGLTPWQPDPTLSGVRPVSDEGLDFIKRYELNPKTGQPYQAITPDDLGNQTFGYGHFVSSDEHADLQAQIDAAKTPDQKQALADQIFASDVGRAQANLFNRLGSQGVASLSQPQYDALVADSFNAGGAPALGPNMAQDIRNGDLDAAGQQFNAYWAQDANTGAWQAPRGLIRRSLQEAKLFNTGDYTYNPTTAEVDAVVANPGAKPAR